MRGDVTEFINQFKTSGRCTRLLITRQYKRLDADLDGTGMGAESLNDCTGEFSCPAPPPKISHGAKTTRGMRSGGGERSMVRGSMLFSQVLALEEVRGVLFEDSLSRISTSAEVTGGRGLLGRGGVHCEPASAVIHARMSSIRACGAPAARICM
jgi:hypothetical protein